MRTIVPFENVEFSDDETKELLEHMREFKETLTFYYSGKIYETRTDETLLIPKLRAVYDGSAKLLLSPTITEEMLEGACHDGIATYIPVPKQMEDASKQHNHNCAMIAKEAREFICLDYPEISDQVNKLTALLSTPKYLFDCLQMQGITKFREDVAAIGLEMKDKLKDGAALYVALQKTCEACTHLPGGARNLELAFSSADIHPDFRG